ncbi:GATA zinc finger-domain-containing protein, partial [Mycena crocata]
RPGDGKECSHCHATTTPLWRRDPRTHKTLCNACGLYLYQRHQLRPQNLIAVDNENPEGADSDGDYDGPECSNCGTHKTSTWRRNKAGEQVCNACGVYERMNGKPRPLALRNDKIRPRVKH